MNRQLYRFRRTCIMLSISAFISGCGQAVPSAQTNVSPTTQSASLAARQAPAQNAPAAQNPSASAETLKPENPNSAAEAEPAANGGDSAIQKIYAMNKNYDIVPKEKGDDKKIVLLTFDDGPKEEKMISSLIDVLDKHKAKAIFFVNGYRVKQNPELLKLIHKRGQIIGSHAWDHIDLKKEPHEKIDKQIKDVQQTVKELTGSTPQFFRPPYGSGNDYVRQVVKAEGMLYMTWSNGSEDWVPKYQNPEGLTKRVMDQLHAGSNILMHELPWTVEAMDNLLQQLADKGYRFADPRAIEIPND